MVYFPIKPPLLTEIQLELLIQKSKLAIAVLVNYKNQAETTIDVFICTMIKQTDPPNVEPEKPEISTSENSDNHLQDLTSCRFKCSGAIWNVHHRVTRFATQKKSLYLCKPHFVNS